MGNKGEGRARVQGRSLSKDGHNTDPNVDESPDMTLSERSLMQKSSCSIYGKLYSRKTIDSSGKKSGWWLPQGVCGRQGLAGKEHEETFGGDDNVLYLNRGLGHTSVCFCQKS